MNVLSFIIEAKDKASTALNNIKGNLSDLGSTVSEAFKKGSAEGLLGLINRVGPAVLGVIAAMKGMGEVIKYAAESIEAFAKIETVTIRMSRLTGSMADARQAMRALASGKDSVRDLFGDEEVGKAAVKLKTLSGGVLGSAADIKILAAAAYDSGESLISVADSVGALSGMISDGVPGWERMAKALAKTGVMSFETVKKMMDLKESGASAGDIVATMFESLDKDHSGAIEKARDSIQGLSKRAIEANQEMKESFGELIEPIGKLWDYIKIGFSNTISFILKGLTSIPKAVGTFLGALSAGSSVKDSYNMMVDQMEEEGNTKDIPAKNLRDAVNAKAVKSDEQKAAEKKAADEHAELLKKKEEAQKKYDADAMSREQRAKVLKEEKAGLLLDTQSRDSDGTDATIKAETRILEINQELLKLKKEITAEEEKRAEKEESLMKRDRDLREMGMTVEQKRAASKNRAAALARELEGETDPDKRLKIKSKMMDEAEKQASIKGGLHSLSIADVFTKADKGVTGGQRDPVREGNTILGRIEGILKNIEKTPGGMTK